MSIRLRRLWPYLAIAVANVLAAVTIFLAGAWYAELRDDDFADCAITRIGVTPVRVCPLSPDSPLPVRDDPISSA